MDAPRTLIVAISRQVGAGGAYVGQALARRLGIRYLDRELLQQAAAILGRDVGDLEALDERSTTVWDRVASILSYGAPEAPFVPPPAPVAAQDELFEVQSRLMREVAAREDAVIVGRGAAWVLRRHPGILRVFLHAPEEWRAQQMLKSYSLPDLPAAHQMIRRIDHQRDRFRQSLIGGEWNTPARFDLCVNTATVGLDATVDLVASLAARIRGRE